MSYPNAKELKYCAFDMVAK